MKKYRTLIVFLAIFVVLVGTYFLLKHVNKVQAEKEQNETIMTTEDTTEE